MAAVWLLGIPVAACRPLDPKLDGTLIAAVAVADGGTEVVRVDLEGRRAEVLWITDPEMSATEFSVSPQSGTARYRLSHPLREDRETLVVRKLMPDAAPTSVAVTHSGEPRLAGVAWARGGMVYGLQSGLGVDEGSTAAWELHVWDGGPARREFALDPPPASPHVLAAWDQVAGTAALLRLPPEGGPADRLLLVRAGGAQSDETDIDVGSGGWAASPDGKWLAMIGAASGSVDLVRLAGGARIELAPGAGPEGRRMPFGLMWSADSAVVAWTDAANGGAGGRVRWVRAAGSDRGGLPLPDGSHAVALSPEGAGVLVMAADGVLAALRVDDGDRADVLWKPPADLWNVDWLPR